MHRASYNCGGIKLEGRSYSEINSRDRYWVVWYRDNKFFAVTSTNSPVGTNDVAVTHQLLRGYNGGGGNLNLPEGRVTIMLEYGNWSQTPLTLTIQSPSGEQIRVIDAARIGYRTTRTITVTQAGVHRVHVDAERDWRLWVGVDTGAVADELSEAELPVDNCSTRREWKLSERVYRAEFKCPSFTLRGTYYPGLNSAVGFWIIWSEGDKFREITFHRN